MPTELKNGVLGQVPVPTPVQQEDGVPKPVQPAEFAGSPVLLKIQLNMVADVSPVCTKRP
jgi:hypothetical protein